MKDKARVFGIVDTVKLSIFRFTVGMHARDCIAIAKLQDRAWKRCMTYYYLKHGKYSGCQLNMEKPYEHLSRSESEEFRISMERFENHWKRKREKDGRE